MKKQLLLLVMILLPMVASAYDVEIDGIYYNLITKGKVAEVTYGNWTPNPRKVGDGRYAGIIEIPESVTYDNVNYSVKSIGKEAFYYCDDLTSVTIPNSVTSIGEFAFSECHSLISLTLPNSITSIEWGAFSWCSSLHSVTIPNNVTNIGGYIFAGCSSLTTITIPNSVTSIGERMFESCSSLTLITIPNSVTSIGYCAVAGCTSLTSVTIPNSVTSIGGYAFSNCSSLTLVVIGSGIKNINSLAFASCSQLIDVYCYAVNIPNTNLNAFNESYTEYATLHVPAESVNAYRAADPWKNFKSIVAIDGETPTTPKCEKPTISYNDGKLTFASSTEGATCHYSITDSDIKSGSGSEVQLAVSYNISVYATKTGYDNSDVVTATLCWIDQKPTTEGITDGIANIPAKALLIKNNGGQLTVEGAADGEAISVYTVNGMQSGSAISQNGAASINTNLQAGSIAIVKIGDKSFKVVIK